MQQHPRPSYIQGRGGKPPAAFVYLADYAADHGLEQTFKVSVDVARSCYSARQVIECSVDRARRTAVIIQDRDGSLIERHRLPQAKRPVDTCYATIPAHVLEQQATLIDRIFRLAFDAFNVDRLVVNVHECE